MLSIVLLLLAGIGGVRAEILAQAAGTDYVAFEAENADEITSNGVIKWELLPDPEASGGQALNAQGTSTIATPGGIARYKFRFATPGKYVLYTRWRADREIAASEPFGANSYSYPRTLSATPQWARSFANDRDSPASLNYHWIEENIEYTVSSDDAANGTVFTLALGTREAGFFLDRVVLKIGRMNTDFHVNAALDAAMDATLNSPAASTAPLIESVLAGHDLNTIAVRFSQAITKVAKTNFTAEGLTVEQVGIDLGDPRQVLLATTPQTEGAEYALAIRGVAGISGAPVFPSTNLVRAARVVSGWAQAGLYLSMESASPDLSFWLDRFEFQDTSSPAGGAELRGYFIPAESGRHSFFTRASSQAEFILWRSDTNGFTNSITVERSEEFGPAAVFAPVLSAGERYSMLARVGETSGPIWLAVAARLNPEEPLAPISGPALAALVNPERAQLRITLQPASRTVLGGQDAIFSAQADAATPPIYFQWQRNGADIPGATQPTYSTGPVRGGNSGDRYRVAVRAGGQALFSQEAILMVNPGALSIARSANGATISWTGSAAGSTLESTGLLGAGWTPVPNASPIEESGSIPVEGGPARFFRLRN